VTNRLVEERLDDTLLAVFRKYEHELPGELTIDEARGASTRPFKVRFTGRDGPLPESLAGLRGCRGHLVVTKIAYRGIESVDQLVTTALVEESVDPLDQKAVEALLSLVASDYDSP
jgi:hypothetical protein